jgi:hypothetical protein
MKWADQKRSSDTILAVWPRYEPLAGCWFVQELVDKGSVKNLGQVAVCETISLMAA